MTAFSPTRSSRLRPLVWLVTAMLAFVFASGDQVAAKPKKDDKSPAANPADSKTSSAAPAPVSTPPAGSSPLAELKKSNAALKKLFATSVPSWSPEQDVRKSEMNKIASGFLDVEELAHRSLAHHWDALSPKQRSGFVSVLRELIERYYLKQVDGPDYDLHFNKETITGNEASVTASLTSFDQGKKVIVELEYKLLYKGDRWLVYDVITDEQSMLENYRAEFNKIITKESFDALLKRMTKRMEKTD
jgi:phospholipid transport system substrate-binding protein